MLFHLIRCAMGLREAIFFLVERGQPRTVCDRDQQLAACGTEVPKEKDRLTPAHCVAGEWVERKRSK
jgi:hypothetical protein